MGEESPKKRNYNSERRRASARETERQIALEARKLFVERGWSGTTMEAIAREAGVAVETIYAIFGNKGNLLAGLIRTAVRGQGDTPILEQAQPQEVRRTHDQHTQFAMMASGIGEIMERAGPLLGVVRAAAQTEPEIEALQSKILQDRLANMTQAMGWIASNGPLATGMTVEHGAQIVWVMTSAEVHHLLTVDLGWSKEKYAEWVGQALARLILP